MPSLPRATEMAHRLIEECLRPGDHAVDATVGNGHDTLFLAGLVGPTGKVHGFDIQETAIRNTSERTSGMSQVKLHLRGHEEIGTIVDGPVRAVMFNLGYLPSGDKSVITRPDSTLPALDAALGLLEAGGILTIAVYTGHEGGAEEGERVLEWALRLDQESFYAAHYRFLNRRNSPPSLMMVSKKE